MTRKIFVILIILLARQLLGQTNLVPNPSFEDYFNCPCNISLPPKFQAGLIFINSDTIKGQIKITGSKVFFFNDSIKKEFKNHSFVRKAAGIIFYPFVQNKPQSNFVKTKNVTSVRLLAADSLITRSNYTDFIHIGTSSSLFRKIYSGSIEIFDRDFLTDESPGYMGYNLIVLDNGKRLADVALESSPRKYLINCVNKKFNKNFGRSDFRRMTDVIKWLQNNDKSYIGS